MKKVNPVRSKRAEQRRGATAVEFAVVAPLILLLFLGAVELNGLNFIKQTAANAAYEGARTAVVAGGTAQLARERSKELLEMFNVGNGAQITVTETPARVTVTIRIPAHLNSYGLSRFTGNIHVTQFCTMGREMQKAVP